MGEGQKKHSEVWKNLARSGRRGERGSEKVEEKEEGDRGKRWDNEGRRRKK